MNKSILFGGILGTSVSLIVLGLIGRRNDKKQLEEINKEYEKIREKYNKKVNKSFDESMKILDECKEMTKEMTEDMKKRIDVLEARRKKENP